MGKMSNITSKILRECKEELGENEVTISPNFVPLQDGSILEEIDESDQRQQAKVCYRLSDIVLIVVITLCANQMSFGLMAEFVKIEFDWFSKYVDLSHGIPSAETIRRLLNLVNPEHIQRVFRAVNERLSAKSTDSQIAIDGKSVKGFYPSNSHRIMHSVSLYQTDLGLSLGQVTTAKEDGKEQGELQVIPQLLEMIDCRGKVFTIDAGGCYKIIVDKICEKRADYIITLKSNQPKLYDFAESVFQETEEKTAEISTESKGHGRFETRRYSVRAVPKDTIFAQEWSGLRSIVKVVSTRKIKGQDKTTESTRYFITSLPSSRLSEIANKIRSHWCIENQLHWSLDVTLNEDNQRSRKGWSAENLVILRRAALSFLRSIDRKAGVNRLLLRAELDRDFRSNLVELLFPPPGPTNAEC